MFLAFGFLFIGERRQCYTKEPDGALERIDTSQQGVGRIENVFDARIGESRRPAPRCLGEVGVFDFHGHRLAAEALGLAVGPDLFGKRPELAGCEIKIADVGGKCIFSTDRLTHPVRPHPPVIDARAIP